MKNLVQDLENLKPRAKSDKSGKACGSSFIEKKFTKNQQRLLTFLSVESMGDLSKLAGIPEKDFMGILSSPEYSEHRIRKRNGGQRILEIPERRLKMVQKKYNVYLQLVYSCVRPDCAHGFVRYHGSYRNNIIRNARPHVDRSNIMSMDLQDFFRSISAARVKHVFMGPPFNFTEGISADLTRLLTCKDHLPQGAPTSPVLSNLVSIPLDQRMQKLSHSFGISYTRYADDLTFSSMGRLPQAFRQELRRIIQDEGFEINHDKTRFRSKQRQQRVTGVIVNKKINVDRRYIKRLRAMLHDAETNGIRMAAARHLRLPFSPSENQEVYFKQKMGGMISFVGQIRGPKDHLFKTMKEKFEYLRV